MFKGITDCCWHIRRAGRFIRNAGEHRTEYTASQTGYSPHYSHLRSFELPKIPSKISTSGLCDKRKILPIFDISAGRQIYIYIYKYNIWHERVLSIEGGSSILHYILEEALDLSFDRLLMMMMTIYCITALLCLTPLHTNAVPESNPALHCLSVSFQPTAISHHFTKLLTVLVWAEGLEWIFGTRCIVNLRTETRGTVPWLLRFLSPKWRVLSEITSCGIYGGQNGTVTGYCANTSTVTWQYHCTQVRCSHWSVWNWQLG